MKGMPLLRWRRSCLQGGLFAHGAAATALARSFSQKRRPPSKPSRAKRKSCTVPLSSKNPVSRAPARRGLDDAHSHAHTDSQTLSSPSKSSALSARETGEAQDRVVAPRSFCITKEKERDLLRYFGRGRSLYDAVPLQGTSFALQRASCTQAQRVPFATLFPASPVPEASASLANSIAPSPIVKSCGAMGIHLPSSCPAGDPVPGADNPACAASSTASSSPNLFAGSNPFCSYELQERQHSDWLQFRLLSTRLSNSLDSNKFFCATEEPLRDLSADMAELWGTACTAWEEAMRIGGRTVARASSRFFRQHVCFLVCYVHTQQRVAIGVSMQHIADEVCALARASTSPQLFRLIPIFIGMRRQAGLRTDLAACSSAAAEVGASVGTRTDSVTYPNGGLYTVAATVQCITRFSPHVFLQREAGEALSQPASSGASSELVCTLAPRVVLMSESWLHVRSIADLHGVENTEEYAPFDDRIGSAASSRASGRKWIHRDHGVTSFVPELTRRNVHVVPAVVGNRLSPREERAIARYIWCDVQRQVG